METSLPKVSIGLPVYNGEKFLSEAIDSILAQTYPDFEIIISDNASSDSTSQICLEYAHRDARIRYYRNEVNLGAGWNFNRTFELARGKYFKWLAHDDMIAPKFLEEAVEVLETRPEIVLVSSKIKVVDENGEEIDEFDIQLQTDSPSPRIRFHDLLLKWHNCFEVFGLIRSDALRQTKLIGNYTSGDSVLLVNLGLIDRYYKIPQFLIISRRHASQSNVLYASPKTGWVDQHAYYRWFNPRNRSELIFPQWKILFEYFRVITQFKMNWVDKGWCYLYLFRWLIRYRNPLLMDIIINIRILFSLLRLRARKADFGN